MIDFIFTLDYEIYGNGEGSLRHLVHDPAAKLTALFRKRNARFVLFVEAAELERIEQEHSDTFIHKVRRQIRELHQQGFEIGLHLHPQWYNARYENRRWQLDYEEYNLCTLPRERVAHIMDRSLRHVRDILGEPGFTPLSFRAGNWLLQPSETTAAVLVEKGIRIESSVFKGGLQRIYGLDYRPALKNGYYWPFQNDVNTREPAGALIEIPTYTVMAPFWTMLSAKRVALQRKSGVSLGNGTRRLTKLFDYLRFRYPLKLDFCRLTSDQLNPRSTEF